MNESNFIDRDPLQSPLTSLLLLVLIILFSTSIGLGIIYLLGEWQGSGLEEAFETIRSENSMGIRNFIRTILLVNHLTMFVVPAILVAYFLYRKNWIKEMDLHLVPKMILLLLGSLMLLLALPFAQSLVELTRLIPLPEWMLDIEESTGEMIESLLVTDHPIELFFNILVIAVVPAIGEELVFRGWFQRKLTQALSNPHVAIWIAAIVFSAIHLQFEGFLARMVLGLVLGYLYFWTKNLWVPIFAHFVNNALQIVLQYYMSVDISHLESESLGSGSIPIGLIFLLLVFATSKVIRNITNGEQLT